MPGENASWGLGFQLTEYDRFYSKAGIHIKKHFKLNLLLMHFTELSSKPRRTMFTESRKKAVLHYISGMKINE